MALGVFQATIVNSSNGRPVPFASIYAINSDTNAVPLLFADRDGNTPLSNPFLADEDGLARFYTIPARYNITATGFSGSAVWLDVVVSSVAGGSGGGGGGGEIAGKFNFIGRNNSEGFNEFQIEEGALPAVAPHFDPETGLCDSIYQRYRVYDTVAGAEIYGLSVCAIMGSYAISCELINFSSSGRRVCITPFYKDETIRTAATWESLTLNTGTTIEPIVLGDNYNPVDVLVVEQGKFAIIKNLFGFSDPVNSIDFDVVEFSSPTSRTVHTIPISLSALGRSDIGFVAGAPQASVNIDDAEISVRYLCQTYFEEEVDPVNHYLIVTIDALDYTIKSHSFYEFSEFGALTSLVGLTNPNEDCLEYKSSSFFYKTSIYSCKGLMNENSSGGYGQFISYKEYTSRDVAANLVEFVGLGSEISFDMPTLVGDRLLLLGYTPINYGVEPKFGGVGVYIS